MAKKISPEKQALLDELVDIRDVKIDKALPVEERIISYVQQIKNHVSARQFSSFGLLTH